MKKPILITGILFCLALSSCGVWYSIFGHSKKGLTPAAISIMKASNELLTQHFVCPDGSVSPNFVWGVNSTMPSANLFEKTDHPADKVSYGARFRSELPDRLKIEVTYVESNFDGFPPKPLYFPYNHDRYHIFDYYSFAFVPIDVFQKQSHVLPVWDGIKPSGGFNIPDVAAITDYYLEDKGGYMDTDPTLTKLYNDPYSILGIICYVKLNTSKIVRCYLIDNNSTVPPTDWIQWKNKQP